LATKSDERILTQFAAAVRSRFPEARIWAFGSRVRGDFTEESDLDVCVVLRALDEAIDETIMGIAWEIGFEHDVVISTVTYSEEEFERGPCSASGLVRSIREDGLAA
jgi:predicted nucleotidyltransferase